MTDVQVLTVDDQPVFREAVRALIFSTPGFELAGEASSGAEALSAADRLHPDLVLLDVNLPDLDGFQVAERITAHNGAPAVVLTSSRDSSDFGPLVSGSGARGFISKGDLSGAAIAELL